ncbi:HIT family protein [Phytohabitans rumicis]|uniref:HIT family protein n=1 Tax=Phytohabitans rumicis TaxID=1076125 RepID=UPI001C498C3D|nr:HIT domain-containing protein [Phytohabitans rumicis]
MDECIFCKIVAGRSPAYRILEDEHCVAFLDVAPASPGHCLVVPRGHARNVWEISEEAHEHVARMVHRVAALLRAALAPDGVNVTHSTGEAAGQEVFHFHSHVVPRWRGDDLRPMWSASTASAQELESVRARVIAVR